MGSGPGGISWIRVRWASKSSTTLPADTGCREMTMNRVAMEVRRERIEKMKLRVAMWLLLLSVSAVTVVAVQVAQPPWGQK